MAPAPSKKGASTRIEWRFVPTRMASTGPTPGAGPVAWEPRAARCDSFHVQAANDAAAQPEARMEGYRVFEATSGDTTSMEKGPGGPPWGAGDPSYMRPSCPDGATKPLLNGTQSEESTAPNAWSDEIRFTS